PAEAAGRLEILKAAGETVEVGTIVARIADGAGTAAPKPKAAASPTRAAAPEKKEERDDVQLSPAVRKLWVENRIDATEVRGTGKGGRLTKEDVLKAIEGGQKTAARKPTEVGRAEGPAAARPPAPAAVGDADVERVAMTRLRKRIAESLVESQPTAAILTTFNEIDMSAVIALRKRYRERFEKAHGVGLGFMSLFGKASILALRDLPIVNASIEGDEVVYHKRVHLGVAVGTPRGLVVPVVRNADTLSIAGLEKAIGELAALARHAKLVPDQLSGGTFTISNGGIYGSLLSTPILTPPQSAILGMHKREGRPGADAWAGV